MTDIKKKLEGNKMLNDFKKFALRGNAVDMAVGIIIGAAFGKIVSSLVDDIIMPPVGLLMGKMDFSQYTFVLQKAVGEDPAVEIAYGKFFTTTLDFVILSFVIFIVIRWMNSLVHKESKEKPAPKTKDCPFCFSAISKKATKCPNCTSKLS